MSYREDEWTFPFTKKELETIGFILSEKEHDLKKDLGTTDLHKFIELVQLKAKIGGYAWIMDEKERRAGCENSDKEKAREDL